MMVTALALNQETLSLMLGWYAVFIIAITLHEAAHALAAWKLGDPTAHAGGQVTLNPLPHIEREPFGTILVPLISFYMMEGRWMIGWASAPYDPYWAIRHPRRATLMALAGPAANLLLAVGGAIVIYVGISAGWFRPPKPGESEGIVSIVVGQQAGMATGGAKLVSIFFGLNLILFLFNLIPIPPLDGSALLRLIMKNETYTRFQHFMRQPMFQFLGLIVAWRIFAIVVIPIVGRIVGWLYWISY